MLDSASISGPTNEQIWRIPLKPTREGRIPSRPRGRYALLRFEVDKLTSYWFVTKTITCQFNQVGVAIPREYFEANDISVAFAEFPEARGLAALDLYRLQRGGEIAYGAISHSAQSLALPATLHNTPRYCRFFAVR